MSTRAPTLVIGLGNPLMGGDAIGWTVAERLRADGRVPAEVEVIAGGTDLLRLERQLEGRLRVILIDALLDPSRPGSIVAADGAFEGFERAQEHSHALSALAAIELLREINPGLRSVAFSLIGIAVASAAPEAALPEDTITSVVDRVIEELQTSAAV